MEGSRFVESSKKLSEDMVCGNAYHTNFRGLGDSLHILLSEGQESKEDSRVIKKILFQIHFSNLSSVWNPPSSCLGG
jgi:hypothetical protein